MTDKQLKRKETLKLWRQVYVTKVKEGSGDNNATSYANWAVDSLNSKFDSDGYIR